LWCDLAQRGATAGLEISRRVASERASQRAFLGVSALLFASWHLYQGPPGVASTLATGLLYGAVFVSLRRLWPLAAAHAVWNLVIASR